MQQYKNPGFKIINAKKKNSDNKTVVVLGVARSGTSMAALVLQKMGVFIGSQIDNAVFEDREVFSLLESENSLSEFKTLAKERDSKYSIWGWKRPKSITYINSFEPHITNPHYVLMFRDLLAVSLRNEIAMEKDFRNFLQIAISDYQKVIEFINTTDKPCLLVSYEKAITKPEQFLDVLSSFLHIDLDKESREDCMNAISPGRKAYIHSVEGHLKKGTRRKVLPKPFGSWLQETLPQKVQSKPRGIYPSPLKGIKELKEQTHAGIGRLNGIQVRNKINKGKTITLDKCKTVKISGFATDFLSNKPAGGVFLLLDNIHWVKTQYGKERSWVVQKYNNPLFQNTGFSATLPIQEIGPGSHSLEIRVLTNDKKAYYALKQKVFFSIY
jgi:hypothetical protein